MASMFKGFQVIQKGTQTLYTTKKIADQYQTKKLLGAKLIKLKGILIQDATDVIDLRDALSVRAEYDQSNMTQTIVIHLK